MNIDLENKIANFTFLIEKGVTAFKKNNIKIYRESLEETSLIIKEIIETGDIDLALNSEIFWYSRLVKLQESEENYFIAFQNHFKSFFKTGEKRSQLINYSLVLDKNNIAFILHNPVLLGHTEVMLTIIKEWAEKNPHLNIFVASFKPFKDPLKTILHDLNVKMLEACHQDSLVKSIDTLKKLFKDNNIYSAIWVSVPVSISYIFGLKLAPKQIIWALKFHPIYLERDVIHVAVTKVTENRFSYINGNKWISFSPPLIVKKIHFNKEKIDEFKKIYPAKLIFGTLARTEKFNSPSFISSIIKILNKCPNSIYLFSGKEPNQFLLDAAKEFNLTDRIFFIGWVDTNLYGNIIDVFLESFPFGCGITSMQAFSQGTHVISLWDDDTIPRWYFKNIGESLNYKPSWNVAETDEEYISNAESLYKIYIDRGKLQKNFYTFLNLKDSEKSDLLLDIILKQ